MLYLSDATEQGAGHAILAIDGNGPYLYMTDRLNNSVSLSPTSFSFSDGKPPDYNFVVDDPTDPECQIFYTVLEGPEVGTYVRGTAKLQSGRAGIDLPDHFTVVSADAGLTVQLTPRSAESLGVAAVSLTASRLEVRELHNGKGDYDVDYIVHGLRRGQEGYKVRRPRRSGPMRGSTVPRPQAGDEEEAGGG